MNQIKSQKSERIHILGIAGTMTAPLAAELKSKGYIVSGSDQEKIYPPISNILKKAHIKTNELTISKKIDLAIIGSSYLSFSKTKVEFEQIKELEIPYISATEFIAYNLIKKESILVAGTVGKTTTTSLLVWIFTLAGLNPSFMFGGESKNKLNSIKINSSDWSITEADESIHGLDKTAKFLYYPVKYLILTDVEWEHKDCYFTAKDNFNAFKNLVEKLPTNGLILINSLGKNTQKLSQFSKSEVITYNSPQSDFYISEYLIENDKTKITIQTPKEIVLVETKLTGRHNFENILSAVSLAISLGIDIKIIKKAVKSYKGIKRRLEMYPSKRDIIFFDDFAQSAQRIKSALNSIRQHYPEYSIKVIFDSHASFLQNEQSLNQLGEAFSDANQVILRKLTISKDKNKRVTASDFKSKIGDKLIYIPQDEDIVKYAISNLKPKDVLVHMSSGGLNSINTFKKIVKYFQKNV
ncbi:MAG: Mur ligase family protein [Candidatus Shapirobacteria bacterium]|nr:Mur ligase family protein [Candidatus Shapirobacteria bacterium]